MANNNILFQDAFVITILNRLAEGEVSLKLTTKDAAKLFMELSLNWEDYINSFADCGGVEELPQGVQLTYSGGQATYKLV